jgi:hypothetical protein
MGVFRGEGRKIEDDYAIAAITGTLGVALRNIGKADTVNTALNAARTVWTNRDKTRLDIWPVRKFKLKIIIN